MSGNETKTVERFGPFLARAWETRRDLPADEQNGVVPLDSKFGFAWRDWRVLSELAARTGTARILPAAAAIIATILGDRAADRRIETLQDRIHRLYAWWLFDKNGPRQQDQARDRGTSEDPECPTEAGTSPTRPGRCAVYTTGQLAWTLLRIGLPRDHPALAKAVRVPASPAAGFRRLVSDYDSRELPHAHAGNPLRGDGPGRGLSPPGELRCTAGETAITARRGCRERTRSCTRWTISKTSGTCPKRDRAGIARAIALLLEHAEPPVRAAAAAALGRLGQPESAGRWPGRLSDPSKIVWRAAAWALRRLGNEGKAIDVIKQALDRQ